MPTKKKKSDNLDIDLLSLTGGTNTKRKSNGVGNYEDDVSSQPKPVPLKKRHVVVEKKEDDEGSDSEFDDGYDEMLFQDEEDMINLQKLSELEREEILTERWNRRKKLKSQWELKQQQKRQQRGLDSSKRSTRAKDKPSAKSTALQDLKKRRAKANREESDEEEDYIPSEPVEDVRSYHEDSLEEPEKPISWEQMKKIQLKRNFLEKYCNIPNFGDLVSGCWVRVLPPESKGKYLVGQIDGTKECSKYKIGRTECMTALILKRCNDLKTFKMDIVSNGEITEEEYNSLSKYHRVKKVEMAMTSEEAELRKEKLIKDHKYLNTGEGLNSIIEHKQQTGKLKVNPTAEKAELQTKLRILKLDPQANPEEVRMLEEKVKSLEMVRKNHLEIKTVTTDKTKRINQRATDYNLLDRRKEVESNDPEDTEFNPFARIMTITSTSSFDVEDIMQQKEKLKRLKEREEEEERLRQKQKQKGYNFNDELEAVPKEALPAKDEIEEIHSQFDLEKFQMNSPLVLRTSSNSNNGSSLNNSSSGSTNKSNTEGKTVLSLSDYKKKLQSQSQHHYNK